jgi:hypothetical protein
MHQASSGMTRRNGGYSTPARPLAKPPTLRYGSTITHIVDGGTVEEPESLDETGSMCQFGALQVVQPQQPGSVIPRDGVKRDTVRVFALDREWRA